MSEQKPVTAKRINQPQAELSANQVAGNLPLVLSAAGALGVAPFAVMRWITGDWIIAIVDTTMVFGFVVLGTFVYRTHRVRAASIAIAVLGLSGLIITVYMRGPQLIYWAFPVLMSVFYLFKPGESIAITLGMAVVLVPALLTEFTFVQASTVFISLLITTAFAYAFAISNFRQRELLVELAIKDPLTGAGNRRALEARLSKLVATFSRSQSPASLIILDLDNFKAINDQHGHAVGDQILQRLTQIINLRIRYSDSLYRIGGEEFVVVVDGEKLDSSINLAEQLRALIENNELAPHSNVTISLGVAELAVGESFAQWLCRADTALYQAKRAGRNNVKVAA